MGSEKKDLTRIEDLGEFIHDLSQNEELGHEGDFTSEAPGLPTGDGEAPSEESFGSDAFTSDPFSTEAEESSSFGSSEPEEDFSNDFSDLGSAELTFSAQEPESTDSFTDAHEAPSDWDRPLQQEDPTPASIYAPERREEGYRSPETFEDVKRFSESSSFTGMATEGNPSFSVLVTNVRFVEDVNDIVILLKELSLLSDSEEQTKARLMRGSLLIPRISEFAAIFLSHKLRRFDLDLQIGLSDEIHPPKHQETSELGVVSKFNLYQNQQHHFHFDDSQLDLSQIIVAATPSLEGHQVVRYLGVASEHKLLEGPVVEDENSSEVPKFYQELAGRLKAHALKAHANAVVGLNYQLTPIPSEFGLSGTKYRLTCTGNLVWVTKR